jgi:ubiquitin-conjugating enzyme E2 R
MATATRVLSSELSKLSKHPIPGFLVEPSCDDLFTWNVGIFGPPNTVYEGAYFRAKLIFPKTYPMEPPAFSFLQDMWHPNVFPDGRICISILHPPGEDAMSGEMACERWSPAQNVETILMSTVSMLNDPNTESPANVDASVMFRDHREEFERRVRAQVEESKKLAGRLGIEVPTTIEEYTAVNQTEAAQECVAIESESDDEKYIVQCDSECDDSELSDSEEEDL